MINNFIELFDSNYVFYKSDLIDIWQSNANNWKIIKDNEFEQVQILELLINNRIFYLERRIMYYDDVIHYFQPKEKQHAFY